MPAHLNVKKDFCMKKVFLVILSAASVTYNPTTRTAKHVVPVSESLFTSWVAVISIDLFFSTW